MRYAARKLIVAQGIRITVDKSQLPMDIPSPGSLPSAPDSDLKVRVAGKTLQVRGCVAGHVVVWVRVGVYACV